MTGTASAASADPFEGVRTAAVEGTSLAYREQGQGEPVVLVHGSASDLRIWEGQWPAIGAEHRAIAYSRRYARPNADIEPGADDQMLPHVEDLAGFLPAVGAAPAHLVGHSWGGFICLLTAIRHPEAVRSLVLLEPPVLSLFLSKPPRPPELLRLLARRPRTAVAIVRFGAGTIAPAEKAFNRDDDEEAMQTFARGVLGREIYEQLPEARKQRMRENVGSLKAQLTGAGFPPLTEDEVRGVEVPALLLTGDRSPAAFVRMSEHLERLLPHAEREEIPDSSHAMPEENPDAVNDAILGFLARQASSG
ncbi:MAG: alpha/beta hydrolase [Thermoleophilaceae bacterium]